MKTWNKITPKTQLEPGTIIGGWTTDGVWMKGRVTEHMVQTGLYLIGHLEPTHYTEAAAFWDIPRAPRVEDCKMMEPAW